MSDSLTRAVMSALHLDPDTAETAKQQLAIEGALAQERERNAGGARFAEQEYEELAKVTSRLADVAAAAVTRPNDFAKNVGQLQQSLSRELAAARAQFGWHADRTAANTGHQVPVEPADQEESELAHFQRRCGELAEEAVESDKRATEERIHRERIEGTTAELLGAARVLVAALDGSDGSAPAWWIGAGDAFHTLQRMTATGEVVNTEKR